MEGAGERGLELGRMAEQGENKAKRPEKRKNGNNVVRKPLVKPVERKLCKRESSASGEEKSKLVINTYHQSIRRIFFQPKAVYKGLASVAGHSVERELERVREKGKEEKQRERRKVRGNERRRMERQ